METNIFIYGYSRGYEAGHDSKARHDRGIDNPPGELFSAVDPYATGFRDGWNGRTSKLIGDIKTKTCDLFTEEELKSFDPDHLARMRFFVFGE